MNVLIEIDVFKISTWNSWIKSGYVPEEILDVLVETGLMLQISRENSLVRIICSSWE